MTMVGFSTGAIAFGDFKKALELLEPTSANAVELSALRTTELPELLEELPTLLPQLRQRYTYISFHAPTDFNDEEVIVEQLKSVVDMEMNIVVHPDTIGDTAIWRALGRRLCLENMDSRKPVGRTADELQLFFEQLPDAKLCFDIAHARQVDSSMSEGLKIVEAFRDRLVQVHLSEVNSRGRHFPISFAAKRAYEPFSEIMSSVPVILESVVESDQIRDQIDEAEVLLGFRVSRSGYRFQHLSSAPSFAAAE